MTYNIVPTPATRTIARRMIAAAEADTGADAVLAIYDDIHPGQVPALIGILLGVAPRFVEPAPESIVRPRIGGRSCVCCGKEIIGDSRRGLRDACYYRHKRSGTLDMFPRATKRRAA